MSLTGFPNGTTYVEFRMKLSKFDKPLRGLNVNSRSTKESSKVDIYIVSKEVSEFNYASGYPSGNYPFIAILGLSAS